jgi:ABC-type nitrate/sulfonate/bicarbonate transport system substrate-binding protein
MTKSARAITITGFCLLFLTAGCSRKAPATKTKATIGIQVSPAMGLLMVAKENGYFDEQGLDIQFQEFTAGKFALQAFLGGSLTFAAAGDVPVTLSTLQGAEFKVLSQVVEETKNEVRVVARRDGAVTDPSVYFKSKKRKLATSFGGGPEFFTYRFLQKLGISPDAIEILSQKPEDMPAALATGSVDAVSVFDPFAYFAEQRLGAQAITFQDSGVYSELYLLTVKEATLKQDPELAPRLMRALVSARDYIKAHPSESKAVVSRYTKLDAKTIDAIWGNFVFAPSLTGKLLEYQEQETAWAKEKGTFTGTAVPDFKGRIASEALKQADPAAVSIR